MSFLCKSIKENISIHEGSIKIRDAASEVLRWRQHRISTWVSCRTSIVYTRPPQCRSMSRSGKRRWKEETTKTRIAQVRWFVRLRQKSILKLLVLRAVRAGLQTYQRNISHAAACEVSLFTSKLLPVTKMLWLPILLFPGSSQGMSIEKFVLGTPLPLRPKTGHGGLVLLVGCQSRGHPAVVRVPQNEAFLCAHLWGLHKAARSQRAVWEDGKRKEKQVSTACWIEMTNLSHGQCKLVQIGWTHTSLTDLCP